MKCGKKLLALILTATMLCTMLPMTVFAEEGQAPGTTSITPPGYSSIEIKFVENKQLNSTDLKNLKALLEQETGNDKKLGNALWGEENYKEMLAGNLVYTERVGSWFNDETKEEVVEAVPFLELTENRITGFDLAELNMDLGKLSDFADQMKFLGVARDGRDTLDVSAFKNLKVLLCQRNELTTLDVSQLTDLAILACGNNNLTDLDVSKLPNLEELFCETNEIKSLDLTKQPSLKFLACEENRIETLDLSNQASLEELWCEKNGMTSLKLGGVQSLKVLVAAENSLTALNIDSAPKLEELNVHTNKLTALELKDAAMLREIDVSNNELTSIDLTNIPNIVNLYIGTCKLSGTLDISGLAKLENFNLWENPLSELKLKNGTAVSTVKAGDGNVTVCGNRFEEEGGAARVGDHCKDGWETLYLNNGKAMEWKDWDVEGHDEEVEEDNGWGRLKNDVAYNIVILSIPAGDGVTKEMLAAKLNEAESFVKTVIPSEDGKNVPAGKKWTTPTEIAKMNKVIKDVKETLADPNEDNGGYRGGYRWLLEGLETFKLTLRDGGKPIDSAPLTKAIAEATAAKQGITVSEKPASQIAKGVRFVTTAEMADFDTAIKTAQETKPLTDGEVIAAASKLNTAKADFEKAIKIGSYVSSDRDSDSDSGSTSSTPSVDKPSSNVDKNGGVDSASTVKETAEAIKALKAEASTGAARASVVVQNAVSVAPQVLKEMAAAAQKAGGSVILMADTVVNGKIAARIYINPALASSLTKDIQLGVKLDAASVKYTLDKFQNFDNKMAVASFAQQGQFGMSVEVALKVDLKDLNVNSLAIYSYDKATNKYYRLAAPTYRIDKAGYLHFNTTLGGDIVITDKPLTLKK